MPRNKPARSKPSLDMTPMVDLAFLLVTFFMLTTKFRPEDPVQVDTPSSIAQIPIPDVNILQIQVSKDGRVFFGIDNQKNRLLMLDNMEQSFGQGRVKLNDEQRRTFSLLESFGVPFAQLPQYVSMSSDQRKALQSPGIPVDTTGNNELAFWVNSARYANPALRIAIKGDQGAKITVIKQVIATLQAKNINKFNLITSIEARPQ